MWPTSVRRLMAFLAVRGYGRLRAARVYLEAITDRTRTARSDLRRDVVDCGGRDAFVDRVPDLAPDWARACTTRGEFRDRLARAGALVFLIVHLPFDKAALSDHCVN